MTLASELSLAILGVVRLCSLSCWNIRLRSEPQVCIQYEVDNSTTSKAYPERVYPTTNCNTRVLSLSFPPPCRSTARWSQNARRHEAVASLLLQKEGNGAFSAFPLTFFSTITPPPSFSLLLSPFSTLPSLLSPKSGQFLRQHRQRADLQEPSPSPPPPPPPNLSSIF